MTDLNKIRQIVSEILEVEFDSVDESSSPDTIEKWDSLSHIKLVMAIEFEFDVTLTPEDMMDMLSVKLIHLILEEKKN